MKFIKPICLLLALLVASSCKNVLDKQPLDKLQGEVLFADPQGVKLYMANLYYRAIPGIGANGLTQNPQY